MSKRRLPEDVNKDTYASSSESDEEEDLNYFKHGDGWEGIVSVLGNPALERYCVFEKFTRATEEDEMLSKIVAKREGLGTKSAFNRSCRLAKNLWKIMSGRKSKVLSLQDLMTRISTRVQEPH